MTEIPEHLLKRSRARKGGGEATPSGDASEGAAVTPAAGAAPAAPGVPPALAKAAATVPADQPKPAAPPEPAYIQAAKSRKKMPVWAMPVAAVIPIWALFFAGTMQQPPREDPLVIDSTALYSTAGCSGCHGAAGGGGSGYQLSDGEVVKTFPDVIDQLVHVARGSAAIADEQYGDPNRAGGARIAGSKGQMPSQADAGLTQLELELVVYHERILAGEDNTSDGYLLWEEDLRSRIEANDATEIDLDALLACADPTVTPGALTPVADQTCPGPSGLLVAAS